MQVQNKDVQEKVILQLQDEVNELHDTRLKLEAEVARLTSELEQRERLAAMIAHDMRGPLTPIIHYAKSIVRPNQKRAAIERGSQIIVSLGWRLARMTKDLLDVSHLSSGQLTIRKSACDLNQVVRDAVEQICPIAPQHHFEVVLPCGPLVGNWDGDRLQQIVGNLLDNAVKYSNEETTVTIQAVKEGDSARLSVHNEGMGIPEEQMKQLFQAYSRLPAALPKDGTGLGLFITRSIVEAHGGKLMLEKLPAGQGTTFSFELPLA